MYWPCYWRCVRRQSSKRWQPVDNGAKEAGCSDFLSTADWTRWTVFERVGHGSFLFCFVFSAYAWRCAHHTPQNTRRPQQYIRQQRAGGEGSWTQRCGAQVPSRNTQLTAQTSCRRDGGGDPPIHRSCCDCIRFRGLWWWHAQSPGKEHSRGRECNGRRWTYASHWPFTRCFFTGRISQGVAVGAKSERHRKIQVRARRCANTSPTHKGLTQRLQSAASCPRIIVRVAGRPWRWPPTTTHQHFGNVCVCESEVPLLKHVFERSRLAAMLYCTAVPPARATS